MKVLKRTTSYGHYDFLYTFRTVLRGKIIQLGLFTHFKLQERHNLSEFTRIHFEKHRKAIIVIVSLTYLTMIFLAMTII